MNADRDRAESNLLFSSVTVTFIICITHVTKNHKTLVPKDLLSSSQASALRDSA